MKEIRKRNGLYEEFNSDKIAQAIVNSGKETGEIDENMANELTQKVVDRAGQLDDISVDIVQDLVEYVLMESEFKETAKAYIIYRELRDREDRKSVV